MSESQNAKFTAYSQTEKLMNLLAQHETWHLIGEPALAKNTHFTQFHSEIHTF